MKLTREWMRKISGEQEMITSQTVHLYTEPSKLFVYWVSLQIFIAPQTLYPSSPVATKPWTVDMYVTAVLWSPYNHQGGENHQDAFLFCVHTQWDLPQSYKVNLWCSISYKTTICPWNHDKFLLGWWHPGGSLILYMGAPQGSIVGLITNNDEKSYREEVKILAEWCQNNKLSLNDSKTKELIIDYTKQGAAHTSVYIDRATVERVTSFKFLGVTLTFTLK